MILRNIATLTPSLLSKYQKKRWKLSACHLTTVFPKIQTERKLEEKDCVI